MKDGEPDADRVVELIDEGRLRPMSHRVTRRLLDHIHDWSEQDRRLIEAFDEKVLDTEFWYPQILARLRAPAPEERDRADLLWQLLRPDEPVDWQLAEYLVHWARQLGAGEGDILSAFDV
jgi:hypothetical protein